MEPDRKRREYRIEGPEASDHLSAHEVAKHYRVSRSTLYRLIREGQFPAPRLVAGRRVWTGADLAAYEHLADRWRPQEIQPERGGKDGDEGD